MKAIQKILLLLIVSMSLAFYASAQDEREDVIYLKNGNIYRGIIIEQVPGESMKIETIGGNVFTVAIGEIIKVTKEKKVAISNPSAPAPSQPGDMHHEHPYYGHGDYHDRRDFRDYRDSSRRVPREYHFRKRGYLFQAQLHLDWQSGGFRIVNGYRFGRFGQLGIGVGMDVIGSSIVGNRNSYNQFQGMYAPIFLHYSGDITKKRITPFYALEAGWAFGINSNNSPFGGTFSNGNYNKGGAMAGASFGVKFHSRRKIYFSLAANIEAINAKSRTDNYYYYSYYGDQTKLLILPGIKLAIGF